MADGRSIKLLPMPPLDVGGRDGLLYEQQNRTNLRQRISPAKR